MSVLPNRTAGGSPTIIYRELRRADLPSFEKVLTYGLGPLERATGLDETSLDQVKVLRRRSLRFVLAFLRLIGRAPIRIFVAVEHGQVVGTASLVPLERSGYIVGVATEPAARGRGVATHLLERERLVAHRLGKAWLVLDVESDNETAIRVYRKQGFAEVGRFDWYVGPMPSARTDADPDVTEVERTDLRALASWANSLRSPSLRDPIPANTRMLSHLELIIQFPRTQVRTWKLTLGGRIAGGVRGLYQPTTRTGFIIPVGWDLSLSASAPQRLTAPGLAWIRTLGGSRVVVVVPAWSPSWESLMAGLGLPKVVSSTLMVRSLAE